MKIIKSFFLTVFSILVFLSLYIVIIFDMDKRKTKFLDIKSQEEWSLNSYLITNVNIVPMTQDTIYKNKMVHIQNGVIQAVSDSVKRGNLKIIDAENGYLSPGLIDMHVHVWDKYELGLYLAQGVTAVRNMWGIPMHLRLKKAIEQGEIISPTFFTASPKLTGPLDLGDDKVQVISTKDAQNKVIEYKKRGYDFIKTYAGMPEEFFQSLIHQAEISNIEIVAHPSFEVPYDFHFHKQIATIEHAEDIVQQALNYQLDTLVLASIVAKYAAANTAFSPTITGYHKILEMLTDENILQSPSAEFINPLMYKFDTKVQVERWESARISDYSVVERIADQHKFHLLILQELHEAGVNIVCSTDAGIGITVPGYSIHEELAYYKQAGLSDYEALKTATINPSKVHSSMNKLGTIEVGKQANLLLSQENPLEDLASLKNPMLVMIKGRILQKEHLKLLENRARQRDNLVVSIIRYAENLLLEKVF